MGQVIGHHWPENAALNHVKDAIDNGPDRLLALGLPDFGGQQKFDSLLLGIGQISGIDHRGSFLVCPSKLPDWLSPRVEL